MKRLVLCSLFAFVAAGLLAGCGEESKVQKKETIKTPEGKTTTTTEKKVEKSGENPPAPPK
jgi:hypothetical protein